MNEMLNRLGMNAKAAETEMRNLSTNKKNEVLLAVADKLVKDAQTLINANRLDVETGKRNHMPEGLIDRLLLTESRIEGMAEGLRQVSALDDPVGERKRARPDPEGDPRPRRGIARGPWRRRGTDRGRDDAAGADGARRRAVRRPARPRPRPATQPRTRDRL